jgi:hypothetical protein
MKITRRDLLGQAVGGLLIATGDGVAAGSAQATEDIYLTLVKANDARIPNVIAAVNAVAPRRTQVRRVASDVQALTAAYCASESAYYQSETLIAPLDKAGRFFLAAQHPDGTIDSGNLQSPPDTGFVVETLATAFSVLRRRETAALQPVNVMFEKFLRAAGEPLVTGGVHTPNHRWVICEALTRLNALFPNPKYVRRIDDWLGEGIYQDADGQYPERSTGIYSRVEDAAFVTMARLLKRPQLLDPVRRNLAMNIYYTHPDGEIETVGSRRQDQAMMRSAAGYYLEYRFLALQDRHRLFAAMARMIETSQRDRAQLVDKLIYFLDEPLLKEKLPEDEALPTDYAKVFPHTALARIRRGRVSATIYGGSDWPLGVASGLASNPTFFNFRKGGAVLEAVRMGANFFSKGYFRSAGLQVNGNQYLLRQRLEVPYYQPLAASERNARGDYPLTPAEDRFWSKLNFPKRRMSEVKHLEQRVTITEKAGVFELAFDVAGHNDVAVTVELGFRRGGKLEGVRQAQPNSFFLEKGDGRFRVGDDVIEFGPGQAEHQFLNLDGASYSAHRGSLKTDLDYVYLTGYSPFRAKLMVK